MCPLPRPGRWCGTPRFSPLGRGLTRPGMHTPPVNNPGNGDCVPLPQSATVNGAVVFGTDAPEEERLHVHSFGGLLWFERLPERTSELRSVRREPKRRALSALARIRFRPKSRDTKKTAPEDPAQCFLSALELVCYFFCKALPDPRGGRLETLAALSPAAALNSRCCS
jgi:hypothetical protein